MKKLFFQRISSPTIYWASIMRFQRVLFLIVSSVLLVAQSIAAIPVALESAMIEGGSASPITIEPVSVELEGNPVEALKAIFTFKEKTWPAVRFPIVLSDTELKTLAFNANFGDTDEGLRDFGVMLVDEKGAWVMTTFAKHARELGGGWYEFLWDIADKAEVTSKIDFSAIREIRIRYPFEKIREEPKAEIIFGKMIINSDTDTPSSEK